MTGCLKNLKELNVSFNRLKTVPPELGNCENLEKLDLSGNLELMELPFEVSLWAHFWCIDQLKNGMFKDNFIPIN